MPTQSLAFNTQHSLVTGHAHAHQGAGACGAGPDLEKAVHLLDALAHRSQAKGVGLRSARLDANAVVLHAQVSPVIGLASPSLALRAGGLFAGVQCQVLGVSSLVPKPQPPTPNPCLEGYR